MTGEPKTLDFNLSRGLGHDITYTVWNEGRTLRGSLWHTPQPIEGDWLVLPDRDDRLALYRFVEVYQRLEPADMCSFTAHFVPRLLAPDTIPDCSCQGWLRSLEVFRG